MKRLLVVSLVLALVGLGVPVPAGAAQAPRGQLSGVLKTSAGQPLANHCIRLRNLDTNQTVAESKTGGQGQYLFTNLQLGNYIVEVLDSACRKVIAASDTLALTSANMTIGGTVITVPGELLGAGAAAGAGAGGFFTSTAGIVVLAAIGVGVGVGFYEATKSPSK